MPLLLRGDVYLPPAYSIRGCNNLQPFDMYFGVRWHSNIAAICANTSATMVITDYSCRPEFINYLRFARGGHLFDLDYITDHC